MGYCYFGHKLGMDFSLLIFSISPQSKDSQYTNKLPAFKPSLLIIFKYETLHTEVVYAYQSSDFGAFEERGTHIFPFFLLLPPFCSKKTKTSRVRMTEIGNTEFLVKIN